MPQHRWPAATRCVPGVTGLLAFFAFWSAIGLSGLVKPILLPTPHQVLWRMSSLFTHPFAGATLPEHLAASCRLYLGGFALGATVGIPLGILGHIDTTYPSKVLKGDVTPSFMIDLAAKDLGVALEFAGICNVPAVTGAAARQMYSIAKVQGSGRQDWTAMLHVLAELSTISVPPQEN